uniref:Uncharacterized protein n=1 Tax=Anguilla anguilla TaxID=7936 RepID=A0A0E9SK91_ANGAN
MDEMMDPVVQ